LVMENRQTVKTRRSSGTPLQKRYEPFLFIGPAILVLLGITIYPLLYSLYMSFHSVFLTKMHLGIPFVGLGNFRAALQDPLFWISLKNTLVFSIVGVSLEFALGFLIALMVEALLGRTSTIIRTILLLPMIMAPVVVALIWRFMYNTDFGIINYFLSLVGFAKQVWLSSTAMAMPAVIAMDVWQWTPFMFLILLAGLQSLPYSPYEAAYIDGASRVQAFLYITLPLLRPILLISLLLRLIDSIKTFDNIFVLTGGGPGSATELLSLYIYRVGFRHFNLGYGGAMSYILLIIVVVLSRQLIRRLRSKRDL